MHCGYWLAFLILSLLLVSPLTIDTVPPLLDYPIHLARSFIAAEYGNDSVFREMFNVSWRPIPNLGGDIVLFFLIKIVEVELAGRILLGFCLVSTVFGVVLLYRVNFGEWSYWPFLAFLPAYHGAFTAGFLNYSIGIACLPFALAASIWARRLGGKKVLAVDGIMALVLLFCHVITVGIFGIFLFARESVYLWSKTSLAQRRQAILGSSVRLAVPFVFPALVYLQYSLSEVVSREDRLILGEWGATEKLRGILMPVLSGVYIIDLFVLLIFTTLIFSCIYKKALFMKNDLVLGVVLIVALFFALPGQLLDAAFIADRLPIAALLVGIGSVQLLHIRKRWRYIVSCLVVLAIAGRAGSLTSDWYESDQYYNRLAQSVEHVERGSSVLIVSPLTDIGGKTLASWHELRLGRPNWHFALLNIPTLHSLSALLLTRRAAFTQLHFVWSDKQILSLSPSFERLDYGDGGASTWSPDAIFLASDPKDLKVADIADPFDYMLIVYADLLEPSLLEFLRNSSPVYEDRDIILMRNRTSKSWLRKQRMFRREGKS